MSNCSLLAKFSGVSQRERLIDCLFILQIVIIFGSATSPFTSVAVFPLLFDCVFLYSISLCLTTHIFEFDNFNVYLAFFFSTIFLCGAWFPIESLPFFLFQITAYKIPTTSVSDLARACLSGNFSIRRVLKLFYVLIVSIMLLKVHSAISEREWSFSGK